MSQNIDLISSKTKSPIFSWDHQSPETSKESFYYEVAIKTEGQEKQDILDWTFIGQDTFFQYKGDQRVFSAEIDYNFSVRVLNSQGEVISETSTLWQVLKPSIEINSIIAQNSDKKDIISVSWSAEMKNDFDLECYEIAIGTIPYADDVLNWQDVGPAPQHSFKNLRKKLANQNSGSFYISLRAMDRDFVRSKPTSAAYQYSDPPADLIEFLSLSFSGKASLTQSPLLQWQVSSEEGYELSHYLLSIGTTSGAQDVFPWANIGKVTSYQATSLSLEAYQDYYFSLQAVDSEDNFSVVRTSEAFRYTPRITLTDLTLKGEATSTSTPTFSWSFESLIEDNYNLEHHYEASIGTTPGGTDVLPWTEKEGRVTDYQGNSLNLTAYQDYYVSVRAVYNQNNISEVKTSEAFSYIPSITLTNLSSRGEATSSSTPTLSWDINFSEGYELARYEVSVGTTPGAQDVLSWADAGKTASYQSSSISLTAYQDYYFSLRAIDRENNISAVQTSSAFRYTPTVTLTDFSSEGEATSSPPTFSWGISSSPGYELARYEVSVGTTPGAQDVLNWIDAGKEASHQPSSLNLRKNQDYYFSLRAVDRENNISAIQTSEVFRYIPSITFTSLTPPIEFALHGDLDFSWVVATSPGYELKNYQFSIGTTPGAQDFLNWSGLLKETRVSLSQRILSNLEYNYNLEAYKEYYFSVRAIDRENNISEVKTSEAFVYAPYLSLANLNHRGEATSTSTPEFYWNFDSNITPQDYQLARYEVSLGTTSGGTDTLDWTDIEKVESYQIRSLNLTADRNYYFSIRAVDIRNNTSESITDSFRYTPTAALTSLTSAGEATATSAPTFSWVLDSSPGYELDHYEISISTTPGGNQSILYRNRDIGKVISYQPSSLELDSILRTLSLRAYQDYYFSVKAVDTQGRSSAIQTSSAFRYTPRITLTDLTLKGEATSTSTPTFSWSFESLIEDNYNLEHHYEASIGTTPGGTDVLPWTEKEGRVTDYQGNSLNLTAYQDYYVSVRAVYNQNNISEVKTSEAFSYTPTVALTILSPAGEATSSSTPTFSWDISSSPGYELTRYEVSVGTTPGAQDVLSWADAGKAASYQSSSISLTAYQDYYFSLRAVDIRNNTSEIKTSSSFRYTPTVTLTDFSSEGEATSSPPTFSWDISPSPGYELARYEVAVGTTSGAQDVLNWIDAGKEASHQPSSLNLRKNQDYYFSLRAVDRENNISAIQTSEVFRYIPSITFTSLTSPIEFTLDGDFDFSWVVATSPGYELKNYQFSIGTTPGAQDFLTWSGLITETNIHLFQKMLNLEVYKEYYLSLRAIDRENNISEVKTSEAFAYAPYFSFSGVDYEGEATSTSTPTFSWNISPSPDYQLARYEVAVGTTSGAQDVLSWADAGKTASYQSSSISLAADQDYYFSIRAVDIRNNTSESITDSFRYTPTSRSATEESTISDKQDAVSEEQISLASTHNPPATFMNLTFSGSATSSISPTFSWEFQAPSDFKLDFDVALGTTPGAQDVFDWRSAGDAETYQAKSLSLQSNQDYYFSVSVIYEGERVIETSEPFRYLLPGTAYFTSLTFEGEATSSMSPTFSWNINSAADYKLDHYDVAIGTTSGGTDALTWTPVEAATTYQATSLNLETNQDYYFSVRVTSETGETVSETSKAWRLASINLSSLSLSGVGLVTRSPRANWVSDPSGGYKLDHYEVAVGTVPGGTEDGLVWIPVGENLTYQFDLSETPLEYAVDYYFLVRAISATGVESSVLSEPWRNPVTVISALTISGEATSTESPTVNIQSAIQLNIWTLYAAGYRIPLCELAIGTSEGATDVVNWVDVGTSSTWKFSNISPDLQSGTDYYVTLRLKDTNDRYFSFYTAPWQFINIVSTISLSNLMPTGKATSSRSPLFSWQAQPSSIYELDHYDVSIGTTPGVRDILDWEDAGTTKNYQASSLSLAADQDYYFSVRAVDSEGNFSAIQTSEAFRYIPSLIFHSVSAGEDVSLTQSPTIGWNVNPSEGYVLDNFVLNVGTGIGGSDVATMTFSNIKETIHQFRDLSLAAETTYYVTVIATSSTGVAVEGSASFQTPEVSSEPAFTSLSFVGEFIDAQAPAISWTVENGENISRYEIAIGSSSGGNQLLDWTAISSGGTPTIDFTSGISDARYVSIRALDSNDQVLATVKSLFRYWNYLLAQSVVTETKSGELSIGLDSSDSSSLFNLPPSKTFEYAMGTSEGTADVVDWHRQEGFLNNPYIIISGQNNLDFELSPGQTYYMSVRSVGEAVRYTYTVEGFTLGLREINLTELPLIPLEGRAPSSESSEGKAKVVFSFLGDRFTDERIQNILNNFIGEGNYSLFKTVPFRGTRDRFLFSYQKVPLEGRTGVIRIPTSNRFTKENGYTVNVVVNHGLKITGFASPVTGDMDLETRLPEASSSEEINGLDLFAQTFVHEWGHAFGDLADEYDYGSNTGGPIRDKRNCTGVDRPNRWLGIDDYQGEIFPLGCATREPFTGAARSIACIGSYLDPVDNLFKCVENLMRQLPSNDPLRGQDILDEHLWASIFSPVSRYYLLEELSEYGSGSQRKLENFYVLNEGTELVIELDSIYKVESAQMTINGLSLVNENMTRSSVYKNRFTYDFSSIDLSNDSSYDISFRLLDMDSQEITLVNTVINSIQVKNSKLIYNWRGWSITPVASNNSQNNPIVSHSALNLSDDDKVEIYLDPACLQKIGETSVSSREADITLDFSPHINSSLVQLLDYYFYLYAKSLTSEDAASSPCTSLGLSYKFDIVRPVTVLESIEGQVLEVLCEGGSIVPNPEEECNYFYEIRPTGQDPDVTTNSDMMEGNSINLNNLNLAPGIYEIHVKAQDKAGNIERRTPVFREEFTIP